MKLFIIIVLSILKIWSSYSSTASEPGQFDGSIPPPPQTLEESLQVRPTAPPIIKSKWRKFRHEVQSMGTLTATPLSRESQERLKHYSIYGTTTPTGNSAGNSSVVALFNKSKREFNLTTFSCAADHFFPDLTLRPNTLSVWGVNSQDHEWTHTTNWNLCETIYKANNDTWFSIQFHKGNVFGKGSSENILIDVDFPLRDHKYGARFYVADKT